MQTCGSIKLLVNGKGKTCGTAKAKSFGLARELIYQKTFVEGDETFESQQLPSIDLESVFTDTVCANGFVSTVHKAFASETPIAFAPSQIWTLVLQAVSIHVNENAEEMREIFVSHQGQKELKVQMDHLNGNGNNPARAWATAFPVFAKKLSDNIVDPGLEALLTEPFSTSDAVDRVVFTITMMDTLKKYFEYRCTTMCGIPKVTLLGSKEDWIGLRRRAEKICEQLKLCWWSVELLPVLDEFVRLASGDASNKVFWHNMYRDLSATGSGEEYSGFGWINVFFPYTAKQGGGFQRRCAHPSLLCNSPDKSAQAMQKNLADENFFLQSRRDCSFFATSKIAFGDYPSGVNKCPFFWQLGEGDFETVHDMRFSAGFLTCAATTTALLDKKSTFVPLLAWSVLYHEKNQTCPENDKECQNPEKKQRRK